MSLHRLLVITLVLSPLALRAQTQEPAPNTKSPDQMECALVTAAEAGDADTVKQIVADDATLTGIQGGIETKADFLRDLSHVPEPSHLVPACESVKTRTYGSTAVVTGVEVWKSKSGETDRWWFTDTFVNRDGRWQLVASQKTREAQS